MKARNFVGENNPFYGKKHSDNTKQKISKTSKGPTHTREKREYWSKTRRGEKNGFFGKTHSSELKALWKSTRHLARWYHNGEKSILRIDEPGEGWSLGRLPTAKS